MCFQVRQLKTVLPQLPTTFCHPQLKHFLPSAAKNSTTTAAYHFLPSRQHYTTLTCGSLAYKPDSTSRLQWHSNVWCHIVNSWLHVSCLPQYCSYMHDPRYHILAYPGCKIHLSLQNKGSNSTNIHGLNMLLGDTRLLCSLGIQYLCKDVTFTL